jgi:transposase
MSHTDTPAGEPPNEKAGTPVAATPNLPDDTATLKRMVLELLATLQERDRDCAALQHRLALLLRRLYGPRTERVDPAQQLLDFIGQPEGPQPTPAASTEPTAPPKPKRRCRPHGRRRLPENLPRVIRHCVLTEAQRTCATCGQVRHEIGTETSEHLDYKPASLFVLEYVIHKYACPCCSKGQQSPPGAASGLGEEFPTQTAVAPTSESSSPSPTASTPEPMKPQPQPMPEPQLQTQSPFQPQPQLESQPQPQVTASPGGSVVPQLPQQAIPTPGVVMAATKPAMPIAKGLPGPGLLAHLIVSKYVEHLPLHRLQASYGRQGFFLPRSTLCDWLLACGNLLKPLYQLMLARILLSRALHTDDTPVKQQDPTTHLLNTARLWGYLGDFAHPFNLFDFTLNRKRDGPQLFLANYRGYLHADAFSGYDGLYLPDPLTTQARIVEVACNAHARRYFYEARTSDALRSHQALAYYRQLYELERQAKDFNETQRLQMRQDLAVPILNTFHSWIEKEHREVLPKSPMAQALGYALNNWSALIRYTEAGFLAIDNNVAEREMKRIAIGRKNWLFVGSPQGGQTAAILMSFTSTCHRLAIEPWAYLQDVLSRLPTTPAAQLLNLVPDRWQAAQRAQAASVSASVPDAASDRTASPPRGTSAC